MKRLTTIMVLIIGLAFIGGANAGDRSERPDPPSFADIDSNSDQLVSREEMEVFVRENGRKGGHEGRRGGDPEKRFDRADTDGDGYLSEAEMDAVREKMAGYRDRRHHHGDCDRRDDGPQDNATE